LYTFSFFDDIDDDDCFDFNSEAPKLDDAMNEVIEFALNAKPVPLSTTSSDLSQPTLRPIVFTPNFLMNSSSASSSTSATNRRLDELLLRRSTSDASAASSNNNSRNTMAWNVLRPLAYNFQPPSDTQTPVRVQSPLPIGSQSKENTSILANRNRQPTIRTLSFSGNNSTAGGSTGATNVSLTTASSLTSSGGTEDTMALDETIPHQQTRDATVDLPLPTHFSHLLQLLTQLETVMTVCHARGQFTTMDLLRSSIGDAMRLEER
jgi:hypothetical protein